MPVYVEFAPVGRRGECPEGGTLLDCARHLGVDLSNLCGGQGTCGRCIVQVLDGDLEPPTEADRDFLSEHELEEGYRLACRTYPQGSCRVWVPPTSLTAPQRTQVEGEEVPVEPEPPVTAYLLTLAPPTLDDLRADAERLTATLAEQWGVAAQRVDLNVLQALSTRLRAGSCPRHEAWRIQAVVRDGEVIGLLAPEQRPLGLAVDLGTTKIAGYLLEMETGRTLAAGGIMNPQISYGEDVVARMAYATEEPAQAQKLQQLVADALNEMAADLCAEAGREMEQISEAVIVGNTAMHHLFLKLPVRQLANAPYVPAVSSALDVKARELGLAIAPGAYVHLLPNIAGYVGADHVAMLLAIGLAEAKGVVLALDIGTNTEVCLAVHGRLTSLSCASGPAFEGAHIKHGMRAAKGAIERLRLVDGEIEYQTIGEAAPVGLCGSGILDALAQLYLAGVVDDRGRMGDDPHVRGDRAAREFVLVPGEDDDEGRPDITFTQKDVRELQLAKGAMRCGVEVLLDDAGVTADQVDRVIIAGAFGTYIGVSSAVTVGLLPVIPLERVRQVGNAAGMGAKMALISLAKRSEAQALARRVGYLELATVPQFAQAFAAAMYLGTEERGYS